MAVILLPDRQAVKAVFKNGLREGIDKGPELCYNKNINERLPKNIKNGSSGCLFSQLQMMADPSTQGFFSLYSMTGARTRAFKRKRAPGRSKGMEKQLTEREKAGKIKAECCFLGGISCV